MAARLESVDEGEVAVEHGEVRIGDRVLPLRDVLVRGLGRLGGEVIGFGEGRKEADPDHPLGGTAAFFEFNATAVEVEVDRETGDITVTRHVTVSDVGKALNPTQVRGQDEGAAIMGLGHTLMEHYILDETGRIRNLGAIDYRIPTSMDLPLEMVSDIVENGDGPGPYGAKGMSEGALLPVAPAVAAAVRDATGVVIRDLPLTPERVWRALRRRRSTGRRTGTDRGDRPDDPRVRPRRVPTATLAEARALVGGKAANLGVMARELGLPVPPGFVITTATCRHVPGERLAGRPRRRAARRAWRDVEAAVGRRFGDPSDPLLVSVRSGAPVSMPGMMDTILDLGLNDATTAGLARAVGRRGLRPELPRPLRGELPVDRRRRRRAGGPVAPAPAGDRGRVPVVEQRSGAGVPAQGGHPRRPRDRRDRPGDGLRQPRRRRSATGVAVHAQPGDRRAGALRGRPVRRPG